MARSLSKLSVTQLPGEVLGGEAELVQCDPRAQIDTGFSYRPDGRGLDPHLTIADVLERRGAYFGDDHVEVVTASITGSTQTGAPEGEALIRTSAFKSPMWVCFSELEVPERADLRTHLDPETVRVPSMYEAAIMKREEIIDACPIGVYTSSTRQSWAWPWKLNSFHHARPAARRTCETLVVDSGVRAWGRPETVLNAAAKVDADWVFATDVTGMEDSSRDYHDADAYPDPEVHGSVFDAAFAGIAMFMEKAREIGCLDKVILPIQPDYVEFLTACDDRGWLDEVSYIAVGGLLAVGEVDGRIDALRDVREYVGEDMNIHALAPSTHPAMLWALRQNPSLVDSLDVSTPESATGSNKLPDATWRQARNGRIQGKHLFPYGTNASTIRGVGAEMVSLQLAQMLSSLTNKRTYNEAFKAHLPDPGTEPEKFPLTADDLDFYLPERFHGLLNELNDGLEPADTQQRGVSPDEEFTQQTLDWAADD